MSKALKYVAGLLVLVIVLAIAIPRLIPAETYKGQIIAAVERATGRTLTIEGDLKLQFRPGLEFSVENVALSNAKGATDPVMAQMARMTIGVDLMAFLSRKISITKFILEDPVISLEVMQDGTANWNFAASEKEDSATSGNTSQDNSTALNALSFGDLRIQNGHLTWRNHASGQTRVVTNVNVDITLPDLKGEAKIKGSLTHNEEDFDLALQLGSLDAIATGAKTTFKIALASRLIDADLDGNLTGGAASTIDALTNVDIPSVRKLATWADVTLPGDTGFGPLTIKGALKSSGARYAFSDASIGFDDMQGSGSLTIDTSGARPAVTGKLATGPIDLRPYMPEPVDAPVAEDDTKSSSWSTAPMDLSGLKALDLNFALATKALFVRDYEIGNAELDLVARNGALTATLKRMELYGGKGSGVLKINGSAPTTTASADFIFTDINAGPLMIAASDRDLIEGKGQFTLAVQTKGRSQNHLMNNLAGNGVLKLRDGKLKGVNLTRMLDVLRAFTPGQQAVPADAATQTQATTTDQTPAQTKEAKTTEFVEMGGTFTINSGVLHTSDFALINEAVSLNGKGNVDIGGQAIDMKLAPGSDRTDGGSKIAMKVKGPWNNITYAPDVEAVVKSRLRDLILPKNEDEPKSPAKDIADKLLDSIFAPKGK